jgi:hypothetical protein
MPTYFASTRSRSRKAVRWKAPTPTLARLIGMPVKARKKPSTEEHDAQVKLFDEHIRVRLVAGAVAFAIPNGRPPGEARGLQDQG